MTTLLPVPRLRNSASAYAEPAERDQLVLADAYGRVARDLRVSLTDRCNLRCAYCMPPEGLDWLPGAEVLTDEEIVRLITIGVERLGITTVRLTGGEPLLRKNLELLVADIAALSPTPDIALTTNGIGLAARADKLAAAGLKRINISLDTLDPDTFAQLARRRRLPDVLAGIAAARDAGLNPVKINTVLLRGVNDHEAFDLLRWAMAEEVQLRFIEQMPLDPQHGWKRDEMITADEIKERLSQHVRVVEDPEDALVRGRTGGLFRVAGTRYWSASSRPYPSRSGRRDRVRLTADGQIRTACSLAPSPTCVRLCEAARATQSLPPAG
jgi:cyclic pyranopterin phosphate synthase